jgi:hypothetical protein
MKLVLLKLQMKHLIVLEAEDLDDVKYVEMYLWLLVFVHKKLHKVAE